MAKQVRDDDDDTDEPKSDAELEGGRMPFLAHLRELRDRVRNAAIAFMIAFVGCWYFAGHIFQWLRAPMFNSWDVKKLGPPEVVYTKLTEPFWVDMSIGMWAGIFVASPFIFYQLWRFIAPGLYKKERRYTVGFAIFSALFFIAGALFCYYFVLNNLYSFLLGYGGSDLKPMIAQQEYLDLTRDMMLAFGAVFEMPLVIYFLALIGLVTHRSLWKFNRWFIVIASVVAAVLTPSPDVVSQIMMLIPMVVLYNVSILLAWRVTKKREAKDAILRAKEREHDREEREKRKARKAAKAEEADEEEDEDGGGDDESSG
jgi:sec-independent protein translocase protein TatC